MKAKQMRLEWDKPAKPELPQEIPSNDDWEPGELIDETLPPRVLKLVNELIWACWITEGQWMHEHMIQEVQRSVNRWAKCAEENIIEDLQHGK